MKQVLQNYANEIQKGNLREQELNNKIASLEVVMKQNTQLNNEIVQLNGRLS